MSNGRVGRRRQARKKKINVKSTNPSVHTRDCFDLMKWMSSRSGKKQLAETFKLVPFIFSETGRGLKTKRLITPGSIIVSIPQCLLVTPRCVLDSVTGSLVKTWTEKFTPHQLLTLFLLVERKKGKKSDWGPFVSSLPLAYSLPHYFSSDELKLLPQEVSIAAEKTVQRALSAHTEVLDFCSAHWTDADQWASWENFRWAWCSVSSRAVFLEPEADTRGYLDLSHKEENSLALCPYLDLLNHTTTARVKAGMNQGNGCYEIISLDAYHAHEQVFVNYGAHDNLALFLHYGFTLNNNAYNKVSFSLDDLATLKEAFQITFWEHKLAILRRHELNRGLNCSMDGLSWNLHSALKIFSMDWNELKHSERAVTGEQLPANVEVSAVQMAEHLIKHCLTEREALLEKLPADCSQTVHRSISRQLVMDDVQILVASLKDLEELSRQ